LSVMFGSSQRVERHRVGHLDPWAAAME
jgi:hypothetical protein